MIDRRSIENAKIVRTRLGFEHGIFTAELYLDFGGTGQMFGGFAFDAPGDPDRIGSAYGTQFLINVLQVLGADSWEGLTGMYCRAERDLGRVYRVGHMLNDVWFDPEKIRLA